jgi:CDP-paratose 2-epimerase
VSARHVLITGSDSLIGAECARALCSEDWTVTGIANSARVSFFGASDPAQPAVPPRWRDDPSYHHVALDIRDRQAVRDLIRELRPAWILHTAAQPSPDRPASLTYEDFDVNTGGTLNLLVAARDFVRDSPFCFISTNRVYGDRPNLLPLVELDTRYDYTGDLDGISETMSIDQCLHSVFGASQAAADILAQEFGRYFDMPVGIFRCGCLTGPQHAGIESQGHLDYIVRCAVFGIPYTVFGYKGKQVRDQIHTRDVVRLLSAFYQHPYRGEVYNVGGGRNNSLSILETVQALANRGYPLAVRYEDRNRVGDHICYISDLSKIRSHFPQWQLEYGIDLILDESIDRFERELASQYSPRHVRPQPSVSFAAAGYPLSSPERPVSDESVA